jgi:glycosyltransferase involved in cell wall biosynthesis
MHNGTPNKMPLSVVIITKNSAQKIRACLESVKWAAEIIIVDSGSHDDTCNICSEYTDKVFQHDWQGFGVQKQRAVSYASYSWILSLDSDEVLSHALIGEIVHVLSNDTNKHGFYIPRLSWYCGKAIHHSGWRPDYVLRLFDKRYGNFNDALVHEKVEISGELGKLRNDIIHYSFDSLDVVLEKINSYSSLSAQKMYQNGKRCGIWFAIAKGWWAFFRTYILQRGFLDGSHGIMLAISNAEGTYYKYAKLAQMSRGQK